MRGWCFALSGRRGRSRVAKGPPTPGNASTSPNPFNMSCLWVDLLHSLLRLHISFTSRLITRPRPLARPTPIQVLDSPGDDALRRDALDTLCAVAVILGPDFAIFVPTVRKVRRTWSDLMLQWDGGRVAYESMRKGWKG